MENKEEPPKEEQKDIEIKEEKKQELVEDKKEEQKEDPPKQPNEDNKEEADQQNKEEQEQKNLEEPPKQKFKFETHHITGLFKSANTVRYGGPSKFSKVVSVLGKLYQIMKNANKPIKKTSIREASNSQDLLMQSKLCKLVLYKNLKLFDSKLMTIQLPLIALQAIKRASQSQTLVHTNSTEPIFMDQKIEIIEFLTKNSKNYNMPIDLKYLSQNTQYLTYRLYHSNREELSIKVPRQRVQDTESLIHQVQFLKQIPSKQFVPEVKEELIEVNYPEKIITKYAAIIEQSRHSLADHLNVWMANKESQKQNYLTKEKITFYFLQIISALDYLHQNNIYYGGMRLASIQVFESQQVKLGDFNFSIKLDQNFSAEQKKYQLRGFYSDYVPKEYRIQINDGQLLSKDDLYSIDEYAMRVCFKKILTQTFKLFEKKDSNLILNDLQVSTLLGGFGSLDASQYVSEQTTMIDPNQTQVKFKESQEEDHLEIEDQKLLKEYHIQLFVDLKRDTLGELVQKWSHKLSQDFQFLYNLSQQCLHEKKMQAPKVIYSWSKYKEFVNELVKETKEDQKIDIEEERTQDKVEANQSIKIFYLKEGPFINQKYENDYFKAIMNEEEWGKKEEEDKNIDFTYIYQGKRGVIFEKQKENKEEQEPEQENNQFLEEENDDEQEDQEEEEEEKEEKKPKKHKSDRKVVVSQRAKRDVATKFRILEHNWIIILTDLCNSLDPVKDANIFDRVLKSCLPHLQLKSLNTEEIVCSFEKILEGKQTYSSDIYLNDFLLLCDLFIALQRYMIINSFDQSLKFLRNINSIFNFLQQNQQIINTLMQYSHSFKQLKMTKMVSKTVKEILRFFQSKGQYLSEQDHKIKSEALLLIGNELEESVIENLTQIMSYTEHIVDLNYAEFCLIQANQNEFKNQTIEALALYLQALKVFKRLLGVQNSKVSEVYKKVAQLSSHLLVQYSANKGKKNELEKAFSPILSLYKHKVQSNKLKPLFKERDPTYLSQKDKQIPIRFAYDQRELTDPIYLLKNLLNESVERSSKQESNAYNYFQLSKLYIAQRDFKKLQTLLSMKCDNMLIKMAMILGYGDLEQYDTTIQIEFLNGLVKDSYLLSKEQTELRQLKSNPNMLMQLNDRALLPYIQQLYKDNKKKLRDCYGNKFNKYQLTYGDSFVFKPHLTFKSDLQDLLLIVQRTGIVIKLQEITIYKNQDAIYALQFTYVNAKNPKQIIHRSKITANCAPPPNEKKSILKLFEGKVYIEYRDDLTLSDIKQSKGFKLEYKFPSENLFCLEIGFDSSIVSVKPYYLKYPDPFEPKFINETKELMNEVEGEILNYSQSYSKLNSLYFCDFTQIAHIFGKEFQVLDSLRNLNPVNIQDLEKLVISKIYALGPRYFAIYNRSELEYCKLTLDRKKLVHFRKAADSCSFPDIQICKYMKNSYFDDTGNVNKSGFYLKKITVKANPHSSIGLLELQRKPIAKISSKFNDKLHSLKRHLIMFTHRGPRFYIMNLKTRQYKIVMKFDSAWDLKLVPHFNYDRFPYALMVSKTFKLYIVNLKNTQYSEILSECGQVREFVFIGEEHLSIKTLERRDFLFKLHKVFEEVDAEGFLHMSQATRSWTNKHRKAVSSIR